MRERIFLSPPHMGGRELEYIHEAFADNYIAPLGRHVDAFENSVKELTGAKYAVALSSGTAAIHLALRNLGVAQDDFVLASSFTFIGSVAPIMYEKATPIFIDCEEKSWNLDPSLLQDALELLQKSGKKMPKALILTHLYGQCADLDAILQICDRYGVVLIEDAAESLGAIYKGRQSGTLGKIGIYSFNGNKIITTSGGGMLVTDDESVATNAKFLSTQARESAPHYEHETYGYNYRMSNIVAAIGRGQMEVLGERVKRKQEIFAIYEECFKECGKIVMMPQLDGTVGNRWLTCIAIDQKSSVTPESLRLMLESHNIESRPLWKPMHLQKVFKDAPRVENGTSEKLFLRGLCLPSGTAMSDDQVRMVAKLVIDGVRS